MTQHYKIFHLFRLGSLLLIPILSFIHLPTINAQESLPQGKLMVFGIEDHSFNPMKLSIGYVDLENNQTGVLVPEIGLFSYKPSPDKHYLAYSNVVAGQLAHCEVRDLEMHMDIIYSSTLAKQCIPLWSGDSRRVILALQSISNVWTTEIFDTQTLTMQSSDLKFKETAWESWEASASPNGQGMIFKTLRTDGDYELFILDLKTGKSSSIPVEPATDWGFVWSPAGNKVLLYTQPEPFQIFIYTVASNSVHNLPNDGTILNVIWSADSKYIVYSINEQLLALLDTDTNQTRITTPSARETQIGIIQSSDKRLLIDTTANNPPSVSGKQAAEPQVTFWNVDEATLTWKAITKPFQNMWWDISPDNKKVWLSASDGEVWTQQLVNLVTGQTKIVDKTKTLITNSVWSPDNQFVSWINDENKLSPSLNLLNVETGEVSNQMLKGNAAFNARLYFVGSDETIIIEIGNNGIWKFDPKTSSLAHLEGFSDFHPLEDLRTENTDYFFVGSNAANESDIFKADFETMQVKDLTNTPQLTEFMPLMVH
ncbi:MAG: hypothetical protein H0X30_22755 [Anaerolineae bacterium]|nr:hypothetical protein [Anaerolineae bacterium]